MQRRAAAAYIALFLVLAAGAYGFIATAQPPEESMNANDAVYTLSQGDSLTVNGRTYDVRKASGGTAKLAWTNESASYTEVWGSGDSQVSSLANASVVPVDGGFNITFPAPATQNFTFDVNVSGVSFNDTRVLVNLSEGSNETIQAPADGPIVGASVANGTQVSVRYFEVPVVSYDVVFPEGTNDTVMLRQQLPEGIETRTEGNVTYVELPNDDGTVTSVPITQYDPLERVRITGSDTLQYRGNVTSISVSNTTATLNWQAPRVNTVEAGQAANVTLNGKQFFGYFTQTNAISLFENPEGYQAYRDEVEQTKYFNERINGFWGVVLLSMVGAGFVAALAYLPRKDT